MHSRDKIYENKTWYYMPCELRKSIKVWVAATN